MKLFLPTIKSITWILVAAILLFTSGIAIATRTKTNTPSLNQQPIATSEPSSWSIAFDNDILVPGSRDQDYTYGFNLAFAGNNVENHWGSLHHTLGRINNFVGLDRHIGTGLQASKIEYGLVGFTPEDISQTTAQLDDRPYASLIYVASSHEDYDSRREVSWQTTLTLGVLGLSLVGDLQKSVHSVLDSDEPKGWHNQISDGGEPTARYSVSRQSLLLKGVSGTEIKSTLQGSLGYITELSWSLSTRAGKIRTPWVSFNPELTTYGEKSNPNARTRVSEQYIWAGFSLKMRAYNAFLEGQFRPSAVTYRSDEINHALVEAWVGYTIGLDDGYSFTYSIRAHSSELKQGTGNRNVVWGGVLLSKGFG